ncbi:MAG: carbon-nitrogen hydrolase family protein [Deltaproteobacteria bacterium]|nr:carbon-nitrogen hydrolase family protein [Deltaproteobacteria bacterium]
MSGSLRIAVAQQTSTPDTEANLQWMEARIAEAAAGGARLVAFPENAPFMGPEAARLAAPERADGPSMRRIAEAARKQGIGVLVGSFAETGPDVGHTYNTSLLFDAGGSLIGSYRKMHLFDVTVSADTIYRESASVAAGEPEAVVVEFEGWRLGLSICYDLRFPELYRALSAAGAEVLFVPAAFTVRTGMAHWHLLLRARAVENLAYVVAPAQVGNHFGARETYGHALVVAPWGEVIAEAEGGAGLIFAELKRERVAAVRAQIPALEHRRL